MFLSMKLDPTVKIAPSRELSPVCMWGWGRLFWKTAFLLTSADRQIAWSVDITLDWLPLFFFAAS